MLPAEYVVHRLALEDIPRLAEINPTFTSHTVLHIQRSGAPPFMGWQLQERPRAQPYHKGRAYDFDSQEQDNIRRRHTQADTLLEVVEDARTGRLVGVLDVEHEAWRQTAWIWNLMLDLGVRRQGIGAHLVQRTLDWARARQLRAILMETQSNNTPACHFYARMGFQLVGIHDTYYTNRDLEKEEVALFWAYALT